MTDVAVVVLAGGESRRFGSDKIMAELDGQTLLDHVLASLDSHWQVVCVGPARPTGRPVRWVREDPPSGGPLAGIAAGLDATTASIVLVVAGDMPWAGPVTHDLIAALAHHPHVGAAIARDGEGHTNPLLAAYRRSALATTLPQPAHGRPAKVLLAIPHAVVDASGQAGQDVDRPDDLPRDTA